MLTRIIYILAITLWASATTQANGTVTRVFGGYVTIPETFHLIIQNNCNFYNFYLIPKDGMSIAEENSQSIQIGNAEDLSNPLESPIGLPLLEKEKHLHLNVAIYGHAETSPHFGNSWSIDTRKIVISDGAQFISIFDARNSNLWREILESYRTRN